MGRRRLTRLPARSPRNFCGRAHGNRPCIDGDNELRTWGRITVLKNLQISRRVAVLMACASPIAMPAVANAQSAAVKSYDIPAQDLGRALTELARQSGREIHFSSDVTRGKRAAALKGALTFEQALDTILAGSGLTRSAGAGGATLVKAAAPGEELAGSAAADDDGANQEIVVTGTNIRGIVNETRPLTVITRKDIDKTGYATTSQLIESLPQNFALVNQAGMLLPGTAEGDAFSATISQGSSINLRGIGEGTTLTLLNGHRMAAGAGFGNSVDITALPLSAIERVDVLTDGASALYGADAIGGVVNFILRRDYEGAESRARSGVAAGGFSEHRLAQTFGTSWGTGSALLSGEYFHRDLLKASDRDYIPMGAQTGSLLPRENNHALILAAKQNITDQLTFAVDGTFARRDSYNRAGRTPTEGIDYRNNADNETITAAAGLEWHPFGDWQVAILGNYARNDAKTTRLVTDINGTTDFFNHARAGTKGIDLKADGALISLPGGKIRTAVGVQWRKETFVFEGSSSANPRRSYRQEVTSAYAEAYVPLVGERNALPGVRRLEFSVAGRYDHYSNFGSAISPQFGGMWEPIQGLKFRGSYGTSYKAPNLTDYNTAVNAVSIIDGDALTPYFGPVIPNEVLLVPTGVSSTDYKPQTSDNYSFGIEYRPEYVDGALLSVNFYKLNYKDIIGETNCTVAMAECDFLIIRDPSQEEIDQYFAYGLLGQGADYCDEDFICTRIQPNFDTSVVTMIQDNRRQNVGSIKTSGMDVSGRYQFRALSGVVSVETVGTFAFERKAKALQSYPYFDSVGLIYNIPKFRMRSSVGWANGRTSANLFWNHIGTTYDKRFNPKRGVNAYNSIDLLLAHDFAADSKQPLSGLRVAVSASNLLNQRPPKVPISNPNDLGFDPTKGSPLGRLIAIELSKKW